MKKDHYRSILKTNAIPSEMLKLLGYLMRKYQFVEIASKILWKKYPELENSLYRGKLGEGIVFSLDCVEVIHFEEVLHIEGLHICKV